jgi:hypothetical protein
VIPNPYERERVRAAGTHGGPPIRHSRESGNPLVVEAPLAMAGSAVLLASTWTWHHR